MLDQHFSRIKAAYFSVFKSSPSDFLQKTSSLDSFVKRQPHLSKFGIRKNYRSGLWNAFRKKIFNFSSLIKQFCCFYSAGWVQKKKKSQIQNNTSPTFKVYPQGYSIKIVSNDGSKYVFPFDSNQSPKQFLKSKGIVCKESI